MSDPYQYSPMREGFVNGNLVPTPKSIIAKLNNDPATGETGSRANTPNRVPNQNAPNGGPNGNGNPNPLSPRFQGQPNPNPNPNPGAQGNPGSSPPQGQPVPRPLSHGARNGRVGSAAPVRRHVHSGPNNTTNQQPQPTSPSAHSPSAPFGSSLNQQQSSFANASNSLEHFDLSEQAFAAEDYAIEDGTDNHNNNGNGSFRNAISNNNELFESGGYTPEDYCNAASDFYPNDYNNAMNTAPSYSSPTNDGGFNNNNIPNAGGVSYSLPGSQASPQSQQQQGVVVNNVSPKQPQIVQIRRVSNQPQPLSNSGSATTGNSLSQSQGTLQGVTKIAAKPTAIQIRKSSNQTNTVQPIQLPISNLHSRERIQLTEALYNATSNNDLTGVQTLLFHPYASYFVNAPNMKGQYAFICAVRNSNLDIIARMLKLDGIELNCREHTTGETALHVLVATTAQRSFPELVALLLYAGCRPNVLDNNQAQPQQYIGSDYSLKEVYDLYHYQGPSGLLAKYPALALLAHVTTLTYSQMRALSCLLCDAIRSGAQEEVARLLLHFGAKTFVNLPNHEGLFPLTLAAQLEDVQIAVMLLACPHVSLTLKYREADHPVKVATNMMNGEMLALMLVFLSNNDVIIPLHMEGEANDILDIYFLFEQEGKEGLVEIFPVIDAVIRVQESPEKVKLKKNLVSIGFQNYILDDLGNYYFRQFLLSIGEEMNLDLWLELQEYQILSKDQRAKKAHEIILNVEGSLMRDEKMFFSKVLLKDLKIRLISMAYYDSNLFADPIAILHKYLLLLWTDYFSSLESKEYLASVEVNQDFRAIEQLAEEANQGLDDSKLSLAHQKLFQLRNSLGSHTMASSRYEATALDRETRLAALSAQLEHVRENIDKRQRAFASQRLGGSPVANANQPNNNMPSQPANNAKADNNQKKVFVIKSVVPSNANPANPSNPGDMMNLNNPNQPRERYNMAQAGSNSFAINSDLTNNNQYGQPLQPNAQPVKPRVPPTRIMVVPTGAGNNNAPTLKSISGNNTALVTPVNPQFRKVVGQPIQSNQSGSSSAAPMGAKRGSDLANDSRKHPGNWSVEEVADWVTRIGAAACSKPVMRQEVFGVRGVFVTLAEEDLVNLFKISPDLASLVHREKENLLNEFQMPVVGPVSHNFYGAGLNVEALYIDGNWRTAVIEEVYPHVIAVNFPSVNETILTKHENVRKLMF